MLWQNNISTIKIQGKDGIFQYFWVFNASRSRTNQRTLLQQRNRTLPPFTCNINTHSSLIKAVLRYQSSGDATVCPEALSKITAEEDKGAPRPSACIKWDSQAGQQSEAMLKDTETRRQHKRQRVQIQQTHPLVEQNASSSSLKMSGQPFCLQAKPVYFCGFRSSDLILCSTDITDAAVSRYQAVQCSNLIPCCLKRHSSDSSITGALLYGLSSATSTAASHIWVWRLKFCVWLLVLKAGYTATVFRMWQITQWQGLGLDNSHLQQLRIWLLDFGLIMEQGVQASLDSGTAFSVYT